MLTYKELVAVERALRDRWMLSVYIDSHGRTPPNASSGGSSCAIHSIASRSSLSRRRTTSGKRSRSAGLDCWIISGPQEVPSVRPVGPAS